MFIFCIDDDEDDCVFLSEAIKKVDKTVELRYARSGTEAVHCIEQYKKTNDLPALITIDINMPGMDGMKTLQEIKKVLGDKYIPIVFLSTNIMHSDLSFFEEQHVSILKKPNSLAGYELIAETLVRSMLL